MVERQTRSRSSSMSLARKRWPLTALLSGVVLLFVVLMAFWPHGWLPNDPIQIEPALRFLPPGFMDGGDPQYWLGTDVLGRDIFGQMIAGARASLLIVVSAALLSLMVGVAAGLVAGHFGGRIDFTVISRYPLGFSAFSGNIVEGNRRLFLRIVTRLIDIRHAGNGLVDQ